MGLRVVTANRLGDGRTVYLGAGIWAERLADAEVAGSDATAEALLVVAKRAVAANDVVDPYLIDVVEENGALVPARRRERIRARGPTVEHGFNPSAGEAA